MTKEKADKKSRKWFIYGLMLVIIGGLLFWYSTGDKPVVKKVVKPVVKKVVKPVDERLSFELALYAHELIDFKNTCTVSGCNEKQWVKVVAGLLTGGVYSSNPIKPLPKVEVNKVAKYNRKAIGFNDNYSVYIQNNQTIGVAAQSESGNCLFVILNAKNVIDTFNTQKNLGSACRGKTALIQELTRVKKTVPVYLTVNGSKKDSIEKGYPLGTRLIISTVGLPSGNLIIKENGNIVVNETNKLQKSGIAWGSWYEVDVNAIPSDLIFTPLNKSYIFKERFIVAE